MLSLLTSVSVEAITQVVLLQWMRAIVNFHRLRRLDSFWLLVQSTCVTLPLFQTRSCVIFRSGRRTDKISKNCISLPSQFYIIFAHAHKDIWCFCWTGSGCVCCCSDLKRVICKVYFFVYKNQITVFITCRDLKYKMAFRKKIINKIKQNWQTFKVSWYS